MDSELKDILYYLIRGLQKWSEDFSKIPSELHKGHLMLTRRGLANDVFIPNNLYDLLHFIKQPCKKWGLKGLEKIYSPEVGLYEEYVGLTREAEEFLEEFATPQESQQRVMLEILTYCRDKFQKDAQYARIYSNIRSFVSQPENAVIPLKKLSKFALSIKDSQLSQLCFQLYEKIESPLDRFRKCPYCHWTLEYAPGQWKCNDHICRHLGDFSELQSLDEKSKPLCRLTPGIQKFVLLPGIAEQKLYHRLKKRKLSVELYPEVDQFDIRIHFDAGPVDIDVKDYKSPIHLALHLNRADLDKYHEKTYIIVPDYRRQLRESYIDQVNVNLKPAVRQKIKIMWESAFLSRLKRG